MIQQIKLDEALNGLQGRTSTLEFLSRVECCKDHLNDHVFHISDVLNNAKSDIAVICNALTGIEYDAVDIVDINDLDMYYRTAMDCWLKILCIAEVSSSVSNEDFFFMALKGMELFNGHLTWRAISHKGLDKSLLRRRLDIVKLWLKRSGNSLFLHQEIKLINEKCNFNGLSGPYHLMRKSYVKSILLELGQLGYMAKKELLKFLILVDSVSEQISAFLDFDDKRRFLAVDEWTGEACWRTESYGMADKHSGIFISDTEILTAILYCVAYSLMTEQYVKMKVGNSDSSHMIPVSWLGVDNNTDFEFITIAPNLVIDAK